MKYCPNCKREYADETLVFCLDDGTPLAASHNPEQTLRLSPTPNADSQPTEIIPEGSQAKGDPNPIPAASTSPQGRVKKRVVVTDSKGIETEFSYEPKNPHSRYGIIYNPYGTSSPSFDAKRDGIIIVRGEGRETFPWDKISKVEITEVSPTVIAKLTLKDGTEIKGAELSRGTLWGETAWGSTFLVDLSKLKTIEFKE